MIAQSEKRIKEENAIFARSITKDQIEEYAEGLKMEREYIDKNQNEIPIDRINKLMLNKKIDELKLNKKIDEVKIDFRKIEIQRQTSHISIPTLINSKIDQKTNFDFTKNGINKNLHKSVANENCNLSVGCKKPAEEAKGKLESTKLDIVDKIDNQTHNFFNIPTYLNKNMILNQELCLEIKRRKIRLIKHKYEFLIKKEKTENFIRNRETGNLLEKP